MSLNLKAVLRTYALLRQLTDDETALLNTLRGMSDGERELLVESLEPVKATRKRSAQPRVYERCSQCGKTKGHSLHKDADSDGYHVFQSSKPKSPRAASLAEQIKSATGNKPVEDTGPKCVACGHVEDYEDHQQPSPHYHEFQSSKQAAATGD
jgi:hypothetical protein